MVNVCKIICKIFKLFFNLVDCLSLLYISSDKTLYTCKLITPFFKITVCFESLIWTTELCKMIKEHDHISPYI